MAKGNVKIRRRATGCALALGLAIAGCSGDEEGSSTPTTAASSVETTDPTTTTEPAATTTAPPPTTEPTAPTTAPPPTTAPGGPVCGEYTPNDELPLRLCDEGLEVSGVQFDLVRFGADIDVDGLFGPGTEAAVRTFQADNGLPVTGVVDAATRTALNPGGVPNPELPTADALVDLAAGEVSIAGNRGRIRYEVVASCRSVRGAPGSNVSSSLIEGPDGSLLTLDVWVDEGFTSIEITRVTGQAGPFAVLAGSPNTYQWLRWSSVDDLGDRNGGGLVDIDQITLVPIGGTFDPGSGTEVGPLSLSYHPGPSIDCPTVSLGAWPLDTAPAYVRPVVAQCPMGPGGLSQSFVLGDGAVMTYTIPGSDFELVRSDLTGSNIEIWATPDGEFSDDLFSSRVVPWQLPYNPRVPVPGGQDRRIELTPLAGDEGPPTVDCG